MAHVFGRQSARDFGGDSAEKQVGRVHLCRPQKQPVERKRPKCPVYWTRPRLLIALINPQIAVDTQHHLIVTHEVMNTGSESRNVRLNPARILSLHVVLNLHLDHGMLASAMRSMNSSRFPVFLSVGAEDNGGGLQHVRL